MRYPAALLAFAFLLTSASPGEDAKSPDPVVIGKLEEIIKIREVIAQTAQLEIELGTENPDTEAIFELADAKIALAIEKGDEAAVISGLESIVKLRTQEFKRELLLAEEDRRTKTEIGNFKIKLLEAEIRLRRAKAKNAIK